MINALVITALALGLPVPEPLGRPIAVTLELIGPEDRYSPTETDWKEQCYYGARFPLLRSSPLPPKLYCDEMLAVICWHRRWVDCRVEMDIDRNYQPYLRRVEWHWEFWDAAHDACADWCCLMARRRALARCREMVGPLAWWHCQWPGALPD